MLSLRRQLSDWLARRGAFAQALDAFVSLGGLPRSLWGAVVPDWCRIKKMAIKAATVDVTSR